MLIESDEYFEKYNQELSKYVSGIHVLRDGISYSVIENFEKRYQMHIPTCYKRWLLLNNGGEIFAIPVGTNIAGILGNDAREKGVFYLEDNFNSKKRIGIPPFIFIFAETCEGNIIGFDWRRTNQDDGVVVYWNHESNELEEEWTSFRTWIEEAMETGKELINYDGTEND